eukprot:2021679-Prymnesium_polylepis.1
MADAICHCGVAQRLHCTQETMPAVISRNPHNQKYLDEKVGNGHVGLCVEIPNVAVPEVNPICSPQQFPTIDSLPSTTTAVNAQVFEAHDMELFDFYKEHGFVVIRGLISDQQVEEALSCHEVSLRRLFERVNARVGGDQVTFDEFRSGVSQFRDLFLSDAPENVFRALTCEEGPTSMSTIAQCAMAALEPDGEWTGMKLLHDHIIVKPASCASKKIPLHQDAMFWPVDVPACSTWTALTDAPIDGGCIEVRHA